MEFNFTYKKASNKELLNHLEQNDHLEISKLQNYIPLYEKFFHLNENNFNNINLNHTYSLKSIVSRENHNKFVGELIDVSNQVYKKKLFFKFSPLLDPLRYMVGKYDISDQDLLSLPKHDSTNSHAKTRDTNNSAYVDGFFTYLTSQILHRHNFIHGVDYYGSYLGLQNNFHTNVVDDLEYLADSEFFNKNNDILFHIDSEYHNELMNNDTRNYKTKLTIQGDSDTSENSDDMIELSNLNDFSELDEIFKTNNNGNREEIDNQLIFDFPIETNESSSSECSSRSSNTDNSDNESHKDSEDSNDNSSDDNSSDDESDDIVNAIINEFPVQMIGLERCDHTLDSLILEGTLSNKEWESILLQVIMILITYQKVYQLTHNDLHTNNIMYIKTEKRYLYYRINQRHYKVPTYGRIFKIIDFGRAIYKFRGNVICSDSFHPLGDAATQYNFEPYFNDKKPRLEPNYSFDLCRLGCSLFDFIIEDIDDTKKNLSSVQKIIIDWCTDDKGRNILYKNNGEDRYPEFKLYKMIARTVHNHVPEKQLEKEVFEKYSIAKKKIQKSAKIMNIDQYPTYV